MKRYIIEMYAEVQIGKAAATGNLNTRENSLPCQEL
jgi:hypothetical protein